MIASLSLVGCDLREAKVSTAPRSAHDPTAEIGLIEEVEIETAASDVAGSTTLGGPHPGLTPEELERFELGQEDFQEIETVEDGLGPVFNEAGCVVCHDAPIGGTTGRLETRFGKWDNGRFDALARLGGSLMQDQSIGKVKTSRGRFTFEAERVPRRANQTALRLTQPLFGLGLVDAIPDEAFIALARSQARNTPSTRGTAHIVTEVATGGPRVGRFGWKAQVPTLFEFSGDAYLNEMGITNPGFPIENAPQGDKDALKFNPLPTLNDDGEGVILFTDFMTFLGPPPRGRRTDQTDKGSRIFANIGCANCHTPTLVSGNSPVEALSNKRFQPFSDFLLHDMGSLGDGIVQGKAGPREMRTAPLWGLNARPLFLHDGRARSAEAAILAHRGQGESARNRFARLDFRDRQALMAFLRSL
jgi:CxxC motif-containing protein (DUF1111 family)